MNPIIIPDGVRPVNIQMAMQVVAPEDCHQRERNNTLQADNARLKAQIKQLTEELEAAKVDKADLITDLRDARKRERRSERKLNALAECKPHALFNDVLIPMLDLELPEDLPEVMQIDFRNPSTPRSNTVFVERRSYNTTTGVLCSQSRQAYTKEKCRWPVLRVQFISHGMGLKGEESADDLGGSPSKKRKQC